MKSDTIQKNPLYTIILNKWDLVNRKFKYVSFGVLVKLHQNTFIII